MIINLRAEQISASAFLLRWDSTVEGATFYVYRDGELLATTSLNEWLVTVEAGEAPVFDVLDDAAASPEPAFPGYLVLTWYAVAGAHRYLVQEDVAGTWTTFKTVLEDGSGYYLVSTRFLEDATVHTFRVLPVGTNENDGTAATLICLMVRNPDPPDVSFSYDSGTGAVTIAAA